MSAETLREAARAIRNDWPTEHPDISCEDYHPRQLFHLAVADWLASCAAVLDVSPSATKAHALAVARAYLGGAS